MKTRTKILIGASLAVVGIGAAMMMSGEQKPVPPTPPAEAPDPAEALPGASAQPSVADGAPLPLPTLNPYGP